MKRPRLKRSTPTGNRRLHAQGSAYLIALLALLVLTLVGMSLTFVTQTEMMVGAAEKLSRRVFYSAESGRAIALARLLVANEKRSISLLLDDAPDEPGYHGVAVRSRLELAPVRPVSASYCNYCGASSRGSYDQTFLKVNHSIAVRARLIAGAPNEPGRPLATKVLTSMVDLQPWNSDLPPLEDRASLSSAGN